MPEVLQREPHGVVVADGDTVRKTYLGPDAAVRAEGEHRRLLALSDALRTSERLTCPAPLAFDPGPPPTLTMTRLRGMPADTLVGAGTLARDTATALGRAAAELARLHEVATGEPYHDLHLRNLLVDPATGTVGALDLADPAELAGRLGPRRSMPAVAAALANLVAGVLFDAARPRSLRQPSARGRQLAVATDAVRAAAVAPAVLDDLVREAAATYRHLTKAGGPIRRLWFATLGRALARPNGALRAIRRGAPGGG